MSDQPQPVTIDVETINRILRAVTDIEMSYPLGSVQAVTAYVVKQAIERLGGAT